jgi:hypothetical protein
MFRTYKRFAYYRKIDSKSKKDSFINEKTTSRDEQLGFAPGGEAVVYYNL